MKTLAKLVLAAASLLPFASPANAQEVPGGFQAGVDFGWKGMTPKLNKIPESVKAEARNPSLYSPYTGYSWSGEEIGSYNPAKSLASFDGALTLKYTLPTGIFLAPYAKVALEYSGDDTTAYGTYSHERDMRSATPSEWVLYIYGMKWTMFPVVPEAGIDVMLSDIVMLSAGAAFERGKIKFFRGIEAYGEPDWTNTGSIGYQATNLKVGLDFNLDRIATISLNALTSVGSSDVRQYGGTVSVALRF